MEVLVEAAPAAAETGARTASAAELAHHVKGLVGVTAKITVTDPGGVERSQGKARRVVDKRPKE
jgi:phenylacetate-CoA ligase